MASCSRLTVCDHCSYVNITRGMGWKALLSSFTVKGEGMKRILRRGHPGALSSIPIPIPPPLFLPLPGLSPGSEASGPNKASTLLLLSSLSPDSCRLLMSSTRRQWRERGTGADWCLPACQWRFLPLPFFLPASFSRYRQDKAVYSKCSAHCSLFQ